MKRSTLRRNAARLPGGSFPAHLELILEDGGLDPLDHVALLEAVRAVHTEFLWVARAAGSGDTRGWRVGLRKMAGGFVCFDVASRRMR